MSNLSKWNQTIKISITKLLAYRLNFFLTIIGPALIFYWIKVNLWTTIFDGVEGGIQTGMINGYTLDNMLAYHSWTLIVTLLAKGHNSMNLSLDIRMGRISSYLIYPFNFWEFHTASFLGFQFVQLFITGITLSIFYSIGVLNNFVLSNFLIGVVFCLIVGFFWFSIQYLLGLVAFWLEETWIMRVMFDIVATFLSGGIIPLDLFPSFVARFLEYTPFPYLTYYPVQIFLGNAQGIGFAAAKILLWTGIIWAINKMVWNKGIRMYTAAGM
jgi:ABC-2 type transport system permease protein